MDLNPPRSKFSMILLIIITLWYCFGVVVDAVKRLEYIYQPKEDMISNIAAHLFRFDQSAPQMIQVFCCLC